MRTERGGAPRTCRIEARAFGDVWLSVHKDPALELTCRPPGAQYGLSSRLKSRGWGARVRVGLGEWWEAWGKHRQGQTSPLGSLGVIQQGLRV